MKRVISLAHKTAKPSLFSSPTTKITSVHINNRSFIVASFHSKNNQVKQENKTPQKKDEKLFIYEEERDLEKEIVPVEVFNDKERIMDEDRPDINIPLLVKFWKMYFVRYAIISTAIFGVLWIGMYIGI